MSDPLRHVLYYAPHTGTAEVLQVTAYSAKDRTYKVGLRHFAPHDLVVLTDAQAEKLQTLTGPERRQAAFTLTLERRTEGIREAHAGESSPGVKSFREWPA